jgi:hypothetical protein
MWRPIYVVVVASFAGVGCNSTLEEFRCTEASDCSGSLTTIARCEPSGHCSFLDTSCLDSGFRFGESSGNESGQCVSEQDDEVDAGISNGPPPKASITPIRLGNCGTSLTVDSSESEAFDGATIESFKWTLFDAADQEIDTFVGAGNAPLPRGLHRLGGDHRLPIINLPSYNGYAAFRANIDGGPRKSIYQRDIGLESGDYRLFFAATMDEGVSDAGDAVTVRLATENGPLFSGRFDLEIESFTGYQFDFTVSENAQGATLAFDFDGTGLRWLDNVALVDTLSGNVVTLNESGETGATDPWFLGDGTTILSGLESRKIDTRMIETEVYSVTLEVTDSNGQRSNTAEIAVLGEACLAPF